VEEVVCPAADWLWGRRSSALQQTGCGGGGRLPCGRLVVGEEVVCPAADWLRRRRSSALR